MWDSILRHPNNFIKMHCLVQVAETAVQLFISNDKPNIAGLVLAGSADFKTELSQSDMFDPVSYPSLNILWTIQSKSSFNYLNSL